MLETLRPSEQITNPNRLLREAEIQADLGRATLYASGIELIPGDDKDDFEKWEEEMGGGKSGGNSGN